MEKSEKIGLMAIIINCFLFAIKAMAAFATGSIALKAETVHTLSDVIASLTVFLGLKIAKRKTKKFPYGLYKIENLVSVVISLMILFTGYEIAMEAIRSKNTGLKNSWVGITILLLAVFITFLFSRYEKKVGKEINSPILLADAEHVRTDVLSNGVVMLAIIAGSLGYHFDKIAALIVVIFIVKAGLGILKDGIKVLLDASVDYETLRKAESIILAIPQVVEIKKLIGRNAGRFIFIEANIVIKTHDFQQAHLIADKIEAQIKLDLGHVDRIWIQYEPMKKAEMIYAFPLTQDKLKISDHFGDAPWFQLMTFQLGKNAANKMETIENPFLNEERGKGILAAEFLIQKGIDVMFMKKDFVNKGPTYVFSDSNVEIVLTAEESVEMAMGKLGLLMKQ